MNIVEESSFIKKHNPFSYRNIALNNVEHLSLLDHRKLNVTASILVSLHVISIKGIFVQTEVFYIQTEASQDC